MVEKEEEVKGRIGVEDACIRMRMSAQIEISRLTSAVPLLTFPQLDIPRLDGAQFSIKYRL